MNPKFSIIIPVYNVAPYLRECLDSVTAQTYTEWEAICVDDGSTDGSGEILDEYAKKDKRFRVMHQANAGVSVARNAALQTLSGEWFFFLDADDTIENDALKEMLDLCGGGTSDAFFFKDEGESGSSLIGSYEQLSFLTGEYANNGWVAYKLYRAQKFQNVRFISGMRYREDLCFWADCLSLKARWGVASLHYYNYRQHHGSASSTVAAGAFRDLLSAHVHVLGNMREKMGASDADVWNYVLQTNGNLNGAVSFAFSHWSLLSPLERSDALGLMCETIKLVGRNPYDVWNRACGKMTQCGCLVGAVQVVRRMVRKVRRTIHCR